MVARTDLADLQAISHCCSYSRPVKGTVIIDVGAHIGAYTVLVADSHRTLVSVEPDQENFQLLATNVAMNYLSNVTPVNAALSDKCGKTLLYKHARSTRSSIISKSGRAVVVETLTLDALVEKYGLRCVDLVKIDVEGAEIDIIQGGSRTISSNQGIRLELGYYSQKADSLLESLGFHTLRTKHNTLRAIRRNAFQSQS
jgi:FkbM family methyltransferase